MRRWLIPVSVIGHFVVIFALFVGGMWHLERMDGPKRTLDLKVALQPPPDSSGGPARAVPKLEHKPHRRVVKLAQPVPHVAELPVVAGPEIGTGEGSGSGSGSGEPTGPCTEDCGEAPQPKPEPVAVLPPTTIAPVVLRQLRISGETQLQPPDTVKTTMMRDGTTRSTSTFKVCLDASGEVSSVVMLKPSGYAGYDAVLIEGLHGWRYRPYSVNGRAIPVCGVVTFAYEMK